MLKLPHFMIIGAMKSATSSLQDQLIQQPGLFMCEPKEPNFFSDDEQYEKGLEWYSSLYNEFPANTLLGEASTHYTKLPTYPETVNRLAKDLTNIKYVYVMRHPIDRLISHYIHEWSMGNYKCDINEAITRYPELIAYSRYAMQIEPYFKKFGKLNVLPVFFDRLISQSEQELNRVCQFIGYKSKARWFSDLKAKNVSKKRIRKFPFYNILVDSKLAELIRRTLVPKGVRNMIKAKLRMQNRPVLSAENLVRLEDTFNKDLSILSKLLNREINCNNFKEITMSESLEWVDDAA